MSPKTPRQSFSAKSRKKESTPPTRRPNIEARKREYLTPAEVKRIKEAINKELGRHTLRNWLIVTMMYRHALRVGEIVDLRWEQVDLDHARLHVARLKNGDSSVHYLMGDEIRSLRKLQRSYPESDFVFSSERQGPLSQRAVHAMVARAGVNAKLKFPIHPHMFRHGKGYQLASRGEDTRSIQAYMGHKNIQHTVLYTKLDSSRFKQFGRD